MASEGSSSTLRASLVRRAWFAALAAAVAAGAVAIVHLRGARVSEPPPVLGAVPDFVLTERSGKPIRRADLDGKPWVANFIFTRCTGMCPALTTRMAALRHRLAEAGLSARFASFSVDPAHDTPEVLRDYAARVGATGDDWVFVTGAREAIHALVGLGFKLSIEERSPGAATATGDELIAHSDRFVLVDGAGNIRGFYHGLDPDTPDRLAADLAALGVTP